MNLTKPIARLFVCCIIFREKNVRNIDSLTWSVTPLWLQMFHCGTSAVQLDMVQLALYRMECYNIRAALPCGQHFTLSFLFVCLFIYYSTFGNVRINSETSQHGGLEIPSSGFEMAWKSVVDSTNISYRRSVNSLYHYSLNASRY